MAPHPFDPAAMQRLLDGEQSAIRERVRAVLSRPDFGYEPGAGLARQRELAWKWTQALAAEGFGALGLPREYGGQADPAGFLAAFETIACHDISLAIKYTVHFGLWMGSVWLLGTKGHHDRYLRAIGRLELPGCFAMTEIGHGSNVRDLETVARWDGAGFIIHSPTWSAGKNYIGNGARNGRAATVFAQLEIGGEAHGVHAFVVPLRDEDGSVCRGVTIVDNGLKMGENGVDNARIWFDRVRVPREALLDRFGGVTAGGEYRSEIGKPSARFFAMISALVGGRISIALAGLSAAKSGLTIAVRYATARRQFRRPGGGGETPLLEYPTHQRRLLPLLAGAYALDFALKHLIARRIAAEPAEAHELEWLAAALKAYVTWHTTATLQTCREACGGEGYLAINRLPALKADSDIFTTFEGDNTVLMLWVGKNLATASAPEQPGAGSAGTMADGRRLLAFREGRLRAELGPAPAPMACFRAAQAYVERVVADQFAAAIARCDDPSLVPALQDLGLLFTLVRLEEHRAWFLEHGALAPEISRTLPGAVETLCARLAPHALALTAAFGLPAACLGAPIALGASASPDDAALTAR